MTLSKTAQALWAGLVADAATMPVHWIYSFKTLSEVLGETGLQKPEFWDSKPPFYNSTDFPGHYAIGQLSVYGEQTIAVLEYLSENTDYKEINGETFAGFLYLWFKNYTGRKDHATEMFLSAADKLKESCSPLFPTAAPDDCQMQFSFKTPAVLLLKTFSNLHVQPYPLEEMLKTTETLIKAHQNNEVVINHGLTLNLLLHHLFLISDAGTSDTLEVFHKALETLVSNPLTSEITKTAILTAVHESFGVKPTTDSCCLTIEQLQLWTVGLSRSLFDAQKPENKSGKEGFRDLFALTCNNPGAFTIALKVVLNTLNHFFVENKVEKSEKFKSEAFAFGVRRNLLLCGDNCGRSMTVASLLNALGAEVPKSFVDKMNKRDAAKVLELIAKVNI